MSDWFPAFPELASLDLSLDQQSNQTDLEAIQSRLTVPLCEEHENVCDPRLSGRLWSFYPRRWLRLMPAQRSATPGPWGWRSSAVWPGLSYGWCCSGALLGLIAWRIPITETSGRNPVWHTVGFLAAAVLTATLAAALATYALVERPLLRHDRPRAHRLEPAVDTEPRSPVP